MFSFTFFFTLLQAAIGVLALRGRSNPDFIREVWNRVGRMGRRLEILIQQWRAGTLPKMRVRPSRAGTDRDRARTPSITFPTGHGWLMARMPDIHQKLGDLAYLLSREECVRFLAEVPQARKIVSVLERMLLVPPGKKLATFERQLEWPPRAQMEAIRQAQMVVGPSGSLKWI